MEKEKEEEESRESKKGCLVSYDFSTPDSIFIDGVQDMPLFVLLVKFFC